VKKFDQWLKSLELRYQGKSILHGKQCFFFHDLQTNSNFHVENLAHVEQAMDEHRKNFYLGDDHVSEIPVT